MGQPQPLFRLFSVFQTNITNFYNKYMWKNAHPVYGAGIRTHDLQDMSLLRPYLPPFGLNFILLPPTLMVNFTFVRSVTSTTLRWRALGPPLSSTLKCSESPHRTTWRSRSVQTTSREDLPRQVTWPSWRSTCPAASPSIETPSMPSGGTRESRESTLKWATRR